MKGAARRATGLALCPMTGKAPKRFGMRMPSRAMTATPAPAQFLGIVYDQPDEQTAIKAGDR
jgi:hypothetical protein